MMISDGMRVSSADINRCPVLFAAACGNMVCSFMSRDVLGFFREQRQLGTVLLAMALLSPFLPR